MHATRTTTTSIATLAVAALMLILPAAPIHAQDDRASLEQQLAAQQARNEELRKRIADLERILATDVCTNPEAAAFVQEAPPSPPTSQN